MSYSYQVIAASGQNTLTGVGTGPAINNQGDVAFVGKHSAGDGLFLSKNGAVAVDISPNEDHSSSRTFGQAVALNNADHILGVERVVGSTLQSFAQDFTGVDAFNTVATADSGGTGNFSAIFPYAGMNNSDQAAFGAFSANNAHREIVTGAGGAFHEKSADNLVEPVVGDNGNVLIDNGGLPTSPIQVLNYSLSTAATVADSSKFSALGIDPGMSQDGKIVAFYGNLTAGGATALNTAQPGWRKLTSGEGIFVGIFTATGMAIQRVTQIGSQGITGFSPNTRVAVSSTNTEQSGFTVVYLATGPTGQTLYESRVELVYKNDLQYTTGSPAAANAKFNPVYSYVHYTGKVIAAGDTIAGLAGTVNDIEINQPIAGQPRRSDFGHAGQIAFYVGTGSGAEAIIRATPKGMTTPAAHITVGSTVDIGQIALNQSEPSIAINPMNTQQIFMSSNSGGNKLRMAYTLNGGSSWTRGYLADGTGSLPQANGDSRAVFDDSGDLIVTYIGFNPTTSAASNIFMIRSTNGGKTFLPAVQIFAGNVDQPAVTCGNGAVWIKWLNTTTGLINVRGAATTGANAFQFGATTALAGTAGGNYGDIAVGPTGAVMISYTTGPAEGPSNVFVVVNPGGLNQKWGTPILVTQTEVGTQDVNPTDVPTSAAHTIDAEPKLAWDRSSGINRGRVYLVYTSETGSEANSNTDIHLRWSDDNGVTWSQPLQVNDDLTNNAQILPAIAVDQSNGNLAVSWYDARNDDNTPNMKNALVEYWGTVSFDGAGTFSPNFKISSGKINSKSAANTIGIGDYTSLTFAHGILFPAWADNSALAGNPDGKLDIATAKISVVGP